MKKEVLKFTALIILTMLPSVINAQLNPKQGFIITNQNDTIYGTIDYLSDTKCAYECRFMANGETDYKVYKPGEIAAYRFSNNGVFYTTKTFDIEGVQKTFFAEYLVQGGVSLFHHKENDIDYYYFIDENGKIAVAKNDGSELLPSYDNLAYQSRVNRKRTALGEVTPIFAKSSKALHDLWVKDINAKNLTEITHDYDMEYCTSAGDCVQYRYNEDASRGVDMKLRIQAGFGYGRNYLEGSTHRTNNVALNSFVPQVGVGADFLFSRSNKHWSLQTLLLVSKWDMSGDYYAHISDKKLTHLSINYWDFCAQIGPTYSFLPKSKYSPVFRGGFALDMPFAVKKSNVDWLCLDDGYNDSVTLGIGGFVGAGVDIAIQKQILRLSVDYQWTRAINDGVNISSLMINAGIRL